MDYSFEVSICLVMFFYQIIEQGALIILPEKKKTTLRFILLDLKLIFTSTGISNLKKAMDRESKIKKLQPVEATYYLWFIGVDFKHQNKGIGSSLLREVIKQGRNFFEAA